MQVQVSYKNPENGLHGKIFCHATTIFEAKLYAKQALCELFNVKPNNIKLYQVFFQGLDLPAWESDDCPCDIRLLR